MGDRLTLLPDLLPYVGSQLDSSSQTLRSTADQLLSIENWTAGAAGMSAASDSLRRARMTLVQTADGLSRARGDVAHRAVLLDIRIPPPRPVPPSRPAPSKNWWEVTWGNLSSAASNTWKLIEKNKDVIHTVLNVAGMIPVIGEVANGANALLYLGEGDYADAALSAVALIPLVADGIDAARLGIEALGAVKDLGVAEKLIVEGEDVTKLSLVSMADIVEGDSEMVAAIKAMTRDVSDVPEVGKTIEALSKLDEVKNWDALTTDSQKLDALQNVENAHANATDRPALPVETDHPQVTTGAAFDPGPPGKIFVSRDLLNQDPKQVMETITHEGRHAWQYFWSEQPENFAKPDLARQWAANFLDYTKQAANPVKYFQQPVEWDAIPYGNTVANGLFPDAAAAPAAGGDWLLRP
jgi:hypothetical protein